MHNASMLVGFVSLTLSGFAWAADRAAAPTAEPAAVPADDEARTPAALGMNATRNGPDRRMQMGASFLPMMLGKGNYYYELAPAYGVGLSWSYVVARGLTVGAAPQVLFNIKVKDADTVAASKQYDLTARVAYALRVASRVAIYGEALAGYSILSPPAGDSAKGLVWIYGVGGMVDVTERVFVNLGLGIQDGLQGLPVGGTRYDRKTRFLRTAIGTGLRL
jgi:hypothetical protein